MTTTFQEHAEQLIRASYIPARWKEPRSEFDPASAHLYHATFAKLLSLISSRSTGNIVVLCGDRGTGKTTMGIEAVRFSIVSWLYCATYGVFEDYLQTVRRYDFDHESLHDRWLAPRLVTIDEIAKGGDNAFAEQKLFHLVNSRFADNKHSILCVAAPPDLVPDVLGPSITDRINEGGLIIHLDWPSFRKTDPAHPKTP